MAHARHVYRVDRDDDEQTIAVRADTPGGDKPGAWVSRDDALQAATACPVGHTVEVHPCPCGSDALSTYAEEHPNSRVADRLEGD